VDTTRVMGFGDEKSRGVFEVSLVEGPSRLPFKRKRRRSATFFKLRPKENHFKDLSGVKLRLGG